MRSWSARILGAGGGVHGAGVLISPHHVLTCAHVVNAALGRRPGSLVRPDEEIDLDFPAVPGTSRVRATVPEDCWFPVEPDERGDIAVLHLTTPAPTGTSPAILTGTSTRGTPVRVYGYPTGIDTGVWATSYELGDPSGPAAEWIQLDATRVPGRRIERGFSGAGVECDTTGHVLGITIAEDGTTITKVAWMLPVATLRARCSLVPESSPREPLPLELAGVLRMMRQVTDTLPYPMRGRYGRAPLSTVYVRQSVAAATPARHPFEDQAEDHRHQEKDRRSTRITQPFDLVFDLHDHLVIEGAAGLGKSTLGRNLTRTLAGSALDMEDSGGTLIPVLLPARVLASHLSRSWPEALSASVTEEYGRPDGVVPPRLFTGPLAGRRWLIVVDALDEIPDHDDREKLLAVLATRMSLTDAPFRYLVTTRPLSPGEIEQLRGPRVGFYELQPFDEDALITFAHNWFNPGGTPAGTTAAEEFLLQVRLADLEDLLDVPLLATVAADLHQSRPDQALPASRYELYEEYINQFVHARTTTLTALRDVSGLLDWLRENRTFLLEALATAYTTSETPLLEVARNVLAAHFPLPPRPPAGWENALAEWLSQTGVVTRHGHRLRFLHQTFAEHLAATARAKSLPDSFDPGRSPWDELVRGLLRDDESAVRVLLHHLHLSERDSGLIDWLQNGTRDQRDSAGVLIRQGIPCTDAQRTAYLLRLEEGIGTCSTYDLRKSLTGQTRFPSVRVRLERLVALDTVAVDKKVVLIDLLRDRSDLVRDSGAAVLRGLMAMSARPKDRCAAAAVLAKFGGDHRTFAAEVLKEIAGSSTVAPEQCLTAAEELARLGGGHRSQAVALLRRIAADPAAATWSRRRAAKIMAKLGAEGEGYAAETLTQLATDPIQSLSHRLGAAGELAGLGGAHREQAMAIVDPLVDDPGVTAYSRGLMLAEAAAIDPRYASRATEVLREMAEDRSLDAWERYEAVEKLAEFGRRYHDRVAEVMFEIATDPETYFYVRWTLAHELGELGDKYRSRAAEALGRLSTDVDLDAEQRIQAAEELMSFGEEHRDRAVEVLRQLIDDPAVDLTERGRATTLLANLGGEHVVALVDRLTRLLNDPFSSCDDRVYATTALLTLQPDTTAVSTALLWHLVRAPRTGSGARRQVAETLDDLGLHFSDQVAAVYRMLAGDPMVPWRLRLSAAVWLSAVRCSEPEFLRELVSDPAIDVYDRCDAAAELATVSDLHSQEMAAALHALGTDPLLTARDRRQADSHLSAMGPRNHVYQVEILTTLASDTTYDGISRWMAAMGLAHLGERERTMATRVLQRLATDPMATISTRTEALTTLATLDPAERPRVAEELRALVADPAADRYDRVTVARILAGLGDAYRAPAAEMLIDVTRDPLTTSDDHVRAATGLVGLGGSYRATAAEIYERLASDAALDAEARREAAAALARLGGASTDRMVAQLREIGADPLIDAATRHAAATELSRLGEEHRATAARVLHSLASGSAVEPEARVDAAKALMSVDPAALTAVVDVLDRLASDTSIHVATRHRAAERLLRLPSSLARDLACRHLGAIAADQRTGGWDRVQAVETLSRSGPMARRLAAEALRRFTGDDGALPRALAMASLADVDGHWYHEAIASLTGIAADPAREGGTRLTAAMGLSRLSVFHRERTADLLLAVAEDTALCAWERRLAADLLARFGPDRRARAGEVLAMLLADGGASPWERVEAASALAELDHDRRPSILETLRLIADDPAIPAGQRLHVARTMIRFGRSAYEPAAEVLDRITGEPGAESEVRCGAARTMAELDGEYRERAVELLHGLLTEPALDAAERHDVALLLARFPGEHPTRATESLRRFAGDDTVSEADRAAAWGTLALVAGRDDGRATETLTRLTSAPITEVRRLRAALTTLAGTAVGHRAPAAELLHRMALTSTSDAVERRHCALALAELGDEARRRATDTLRRLIADVSDDPAELALSAFALASLDPTHRAAAEQAAITALDAADISADQRGQIADQLAGSGRRHQHAATLVLYGLVTDAALDARTRFEAVRRLRWLTGLEWLTGTDDRIKEPVPRWIPMYT
ncbi:hypothetical protein GCM10009677_50020 [Sphaerisporangium rubeum]|uniref:NACHT domain-containing protein n=1 Tax=Sphaerisporangium rubeum TaxID=321317 RepID=A0A7X0M7W3_9ACTN|nr:hypothetical protein [Sphaerisporangium rubeum]